MAKKLSEKMLNRIKIRVYKKEPDDRTILCGESVKVDKNGRQYFDISYHLADYIKGIFPQYEVGEEFIEDDGKKG